MSRRVSLHQLKLFLPIVFAAVLVAGCGGGGGGTASLQSGDIAVVGQSHVARRDFDTLLASAKRSFRTQGKPFPKQGTPEYEAVKGQAVALLVQQAERSEKAKSEGVKISDKQIDDRLGQIKKQYFGGSDKKYQAQLKKQHLTDAQVRSDIRSQLISEAVFKKLGDQVKVSDKDIHAYYESHLQQYAHGATRDVRHILVKSKGKADTIYAQLKAGNAQTWCKLAKQFSQDPSSKDNCGKLTVTKGKTVPVFNKVAFDDPANQIHAPVHDPTYGWFVIEPLSAIHPPSKTPEKQVAETIRAQLLQQKKDQAMTDWIGSLPKTFCKGGKIKYQVGFKPSPDPCASTTSTTSTT